MLSAGASYGYMTSVRSIPVPMASLTFFTFPLMVGPLAHLLGDERLTLRRVIALGVGFSGLALVLGGGLGDADPVGLAMAFGGGTCVAVSFQVSRRLTVDIAPTQLTATVAVGSGLLCGLLLTVHGDIHLPDTPRGWIGVLGGSTYRYITNDATVPSAPIVYSTADFVVCFLAGTRIATPGGSAAIESLEIGDLVLTATSHQSRNLRFGIALGRGETIGAQQGSLVEGAFAAAVSARLAEGHQIEMPITQAVAAIIDGRLDIPTAITQLMSRPITTE